jgi:hypothetical protein
MYSSEDLACILGAQEKRPERMGLAKAGADASAPAATGAAPPSPSGTPSVSKGALAPFGRALDTTAGCTSPSFRLRHARGCCRGLQDDASTGLMTITQSISVNDYFAAKLAAKRAGASAPAPEREIPVQEATSTQQHSKQKATKKMQSSEEAGAAAPVKSRKRAGDGLSEAPSKATKTNSDRARPEVQDEAVTDTNASGTDHAKKKKLKEEKKRKKKEEKMKMKMADKGKEGAKDTTTKKKKKKRKPQHANTEASR